MCLDRCLSVGCAREFMCPRGHLGLQVVSQLMWLPESQSQVLWKSGDVLLTTEPSLLTVLYKWSKPSAESKCSRVHSQEVPGAVGKSVSGHPGWGWGSEGQSFRFEIGSEDGWSCHVAAVSITEPVLSSGCSWTYKTQWPYLRLQRCDL